jgi:hypothetical protein
VRKLNDSQLTVIARQRKSKLLQAIVSDFSKVNRLNFSSCNLRLNDWIFCQCLSQRRIGQTILDDHLLAAEKTNVAITCHLRCATSQLCFDPIGCLNRIVHHRFGNCDRQPSKMRLQHWIKLPNFIFGNARLDFVTAGLKRSALETNREKLLALFAIRPAGDNHFHRARANERAMLAALTNSRQIILVEIASDWIGHRADNQRPTVCERTELIRLQKPKSLHRHLDQRIGQSLCRGLLEPLFQVFSERRHRRESSGAPGGCKAANFAPAFAENRRYGGCAR